jgi:hypothetical protein
LVKRAHRSEPSTCLNQSFLHYELDFTDTLLLCNGSYAADNVESVVRTRGLCTCVEKEKVARVDFEDSGLGVGGAMDRVLRIQRI